MRKHPYSFYATLICLMLVISACNLATGSPTVPAAGAGSSPEPGGPPAGGGEAATATTGISYITMPTDPSTIVSATKDDIFPSSYGDNYPVNLYERPFQLDNVYRPDADIIWTFISDDGDWYYFSTQIVDSNPATKTMDTPYGIEIDVDLDGRGDFLLWATPPYATGWTKANVQLFTDPNNDVGGPRPLLSDAPYNGNGYETLVFDRGSGPDPDTAWVRQAPLDPTYLQIAVKKTAIADSTFLWNAWTDFGLANPAQFDYNDFYTAQQAGSPYAADPNFPIKALYGMDNTCRVAYGFTPTGHEPGVCGGEQTVNNVPTTQPGGGYTGIPVLVRQTPTPTNPPSEPPGGGITVTPPPPSTGIITGFVYWDMNGNGVQDAGESPESSMPVYLYRDGCAYTLGTTTPDSNGAYSFSGLALGTYCVMYAPPPGYNLGAPGSPVPGVGVNDVMPSRIDFRILPPG